MTTPTPETTPGQPAPQAPAQPAPSGYIEQARYTGAIQKIEELTIASRTLSEQLAAKTSEIEQLRTQLGVKDAEKSAAISERDKQIQSYVQQQSSAEKELGELRAMQLKMDVAKELGRLDLLKVADTIPAMTDREALKTVMGNIAGLVEEAVREREKQLLAGITAPIENGGQKTNPLPASAKDWDGYLASLTLGSPERERAMDAYWNWLAGQHNNS